MRKFAVVLIVALCTMAAFGEGTSSQSSAFKFNGGITLGTDVLESATGTSESWTKLGFTPDLSFGKVGVGIDLSAHFQLYPNASDAIQFYEGDWVPTEKTFSGWLGLYLPKIMYVRYGAKGTDPLFVKVGSMDDFTLGNGFIMGDYSNKSFLPTTRIIGLDFGLDGSFFQFPLVGLELVAGNVAEFDVIGGRVYARPFVTTSIPILKNATVGLTLVADTDAYLYDSAKTATAKTVSAWGLDVTVPIVTNQAFPLSASADMAIDPNSSFGSTIGVAGRLISFITYGAKLRVMQDGFIAEYFDSNYDVYRSTRYDYMQSTTGGDLQAGYYASLGFSLLEGKVAFQAKLDGPFAAKPSTASDYQGDYPHLKGTFTLAQGILGTFWANASYEKYFIGKTQAFFADLVDPTNAAVGMNINYQTGASVLTLAYKAHYDPLASTGSDWVVTSSITATMKF